jgi:hypothetical protein
VYSKELKEEVNAPTYLDQQDVIPHRTPLPNPLKFMGIKQPSVEFCLL